MKTNKPLFPPRDELSLANSDEPTAPPPRRAITTQDHDVIRQWAEHHHAEPATGVETRSGPATIEAAGAVVRFNFPAAGRFRPITWDEWFELFDGHRLLFVYEEEVADRAYELSHARGGEPGHDLDDWLEAERQLEPKEAQSGRYRFITPPADRERQG